MKVNALTGNNTEHILEKYRYSTFQEKLYTIFLSGKSNIIIVNMAKLTESFLTYRQKEIQ